MNSLPSTILRLVLGTFLFLSPAAILSAQEKVKEKEAVKEKPPFQEVFKKLNAQAKAAFQKDHVGGLKEVERIARLLIKDYPEEPNPYSMLAFVAGRTSDSEKKTATLKELAALDDSDPKIARIVGQAKGQLKKMEALGKPLEMKFTAADGREVDLAEMKGKVVLIDFWATWCGPCVREIPTVVKAYEKLHPKGFEIIGISLERDKDPAKLLAYVKKKNMPWPQYHDGLFWNNKLSKEHGISSIPAMWLVDKKGNLVDQNARSGLEGKVEKYLAQ